MVTKELFLLFFIVTLLLSVVVRCQSRTPSQVNAYEGTNYYVDSLNGADKNPGTSESQPWKTLVKVSQQNFQPGDTIHFKRGSSWIVTDERRGFIIDDSGLQNQPIIFTSYGQGERPVFQNPGNNQYHTQTITIEADWVILEGILVKNSQREGVYLAYGAEHNLVRDVEITEVGIGIGIHGKYNRVSQNFIHDLHMVINTPGGDDDFGAVGIWLFASNNEISYNRLINCKAQSFDYGFDGGAVEFYGATDNNLIHHNRAENSGGFFEVGGGSAKNNILAYNISFNNGVLGGFHLSGRFASQVENFRFENNTVVETGSDKMKYVLVWWNGEPSSNTLIMRNNIFYINQFWFLTQKAGFTHTHNLYYLADERTKLCHQGDFLPDTTEILDDPLFVDLENQDFRLQKESPAVDVGENLGYSLDFDNRSVPVGAAPDIGAYEHGTSLVGDLNDDWEIDFSDFKVLLENWGDNPIKKKADFNEDGLVNGVDFGMMLQLIP